ncbi:MAG: hypothetical protein AAGI53_02070 [Planctomycetota bacterium]
MQMNIAALTIGALAGVAAADFTTVFQHGFNNQASGVINAASDLNAFIGSYSFSGNAFGGISSTRPAFVAAHNSNGVAGVNQMAINNVDFGTDFTSPVTRVADAGGGDRLFADFTQAGEFTGGSVTDVRFRLGSFGNGNTGGFKYNFVRGLDDMGNELFELLFVAGSSGQIREVFARSADDDSTTLTDANNGTPEGTKLVESSSSAFNSTNATTRPQQMWDVDIIIEDGMVNYTIGGPGNVLTTTAMDGSFAVNSSATSISRLEFSSVWNSVADGQNKGYWVDDIFVQTDIIPSPGVLSVAGALTILAARRRRG